MADIIIEHVSKTLCMHCFISSSYNTMKNYYAHITDDKIGLERLNNFPI